MSSSFGACPDITDMLLGGNVSNPELGSTFNDTVLVHNKLLLCVMYCWPLTFQLQPILKLHYQLSPKIMFLHKSCRTINLSVNCLLPHLNVRSDWPIGPILALLADVTLCMCTFISWGICGDELKNFTESNWYIFCCV